MVKIDDFHIKFNEQWAVYRPGDAVTGTVFLRFPERMFCDSVQVQCFGSARVFWVEQQVKPPHGLRSHPLSAERIYFDMKQTVWRDSSVPAGQEVKKSPSIDQLVEQSRGLKLKEVAARASTDRPVLDGGCCHKFDFSFTLPDIELPTSFDAAHSVGYVRYFVKANIMEVDAIKHSRKEYFTVIKPFDLNIVPKAHQPVTEHKERALQTIGGVCCIGGEGQVSVMGTLQKMGHVPGEQLKVSAEIDNQSGATIIRMKARLVQHVVCYSEVPECKMHESAHQVAAVSQELKIRPGQSWLWDSNPAMYIPAVAPTFRETQLMEVSYSLIIDIYASKEMPCLAVALPVLIGTVPINNNASLPVMASINGDPAGQKSSLVHRNVAPSGGETNNHRDSPPLYEDAIAPPAYQESILGRTETQGNLATEYLPRYAVYQFPAADTPLVTC